MKELEIAIFENLDVFEYKFDDKNPILLMMVGLPGSGKTTAAKSIEVSYNQKVHKPIHHSSDELRKQLYGDENSQEHNEQLFLELHRRIKSDLLAGKDVIYDATNISKKRRIAFLAELKNIPCYKVCVVVATPYDVCIKFNASRERKVPDEVIKRMYMNWCPPDYSEGFDEISVLYNYDDKAARLRYTIQYFFEGENGANKMSQENKHHSLTLGHHCADAYKYIEAHYPEDTILQIATLLHDNGKVFTKTTVNSRGDVDGDCHYYQHECVGAYNSLFYTDVLELTDREKIYVSNLIYYHMRPYLSWKQSEKAMNKDRVRIGEKMFDDIMRLHAADIIAH